MKINMDVFNKIFKFEKVSDVDALIHLQWFHRCSSPRAFCDQSKEEEKKKPGTLNLLL